MSEWERAEAQVRGAVRQRVLGKELHLQNKSNYKNYTTMKKILGVLFFTLIAGSFASAQSIPQEILGVKIGETMQEDAHNILIEQNLTYDSIFSNPYRYIYYEGKINHEGIEWNEIGLSFTNNKLSSWILYLDCENDCEEMRLAFIDSLENKYHSLSPADSSLYSFTYVEYYAERNNSELWTKFDGNILLAVCKRTNGFACLYYHENNIKEYQIAKQREDSIAEVKWQARLDSIRHMNDSLKQLQVVDIDRYKLYPTQNIYTLLELDTQTGRIWQVQYSVEGPKYRFKTHLNRWSLLEDSDLQVSGRFELYPTQNNYNFVLLDKISGKTWQVQWSTEYNTRGYWEIE